MVAGLTSHAKGPDTAWDDVLALKLRKSDLLVCQVNELLMVKTSLMAFCPKFGVPGLLPRSAASAHWHQPCSTNFLWTEEQWYKLGLGFNPWDIW